MKIESKLQSGIVKVPNKLGAKLAVTSYEVSITNQSVYREILKKCKKDNIVVENHISENKYL